MPLQFTDLRNLTIIFFSHIPPSRFHKLRHIMRVIKFDYSQMELLSRCVCMKVNSTLIFIDIIYERKERARKKIHYRNLFVQNNKKRDDYVCVCVCEEIFHIFHLNFHPCHVMHVFWAFLTHFLPQTHVSSAAMLSVVKVAALRKTIRIYFTKFNFYFSWSIHVWFKTLRGFISRARFHVLRFKNIKFKLKTRRITSTQTIGLLRRQIKACNYAHLSNATTWACIDAAR